MGAPVDWPWVRVEALWGEGPARVIVSSMRSWRPTQAGKFGETHSLMGKVCGWVRDGFSLSEIWICLVRNLSFQDLLLVEIGVLTSLTSNTKTLKTKFETIKLDPSNWNPIQLELIHHLFPNLDLKQILRSHHFDLRKTMFFSCCTGHDFFRASAGRSVGSMQPPLQADTPTITPSAIDLCQGYEGSPRISKYSWWKEEIQNNHLGCMKPVVYTGITYLSTGAGFLNHQKYLQLNEGKNPSIWVSFWFIPSFSH